MLLVIDNYDSFTYNLVQYLAEIGADVKVFRNDKITVPEIEDMDPQHIVISPGPGDPDQAGITLEVIRHFAGKVPLLGVCLGHQSIGQAFGGRVVQAPELVHGKTSMIEHDGRTLYKDIDQPFIATRYHSLIVAREGLPDVLEVSAWDRDSNVIMGLRHRELPVEGVQFHPESILTVQGKQLLKNFLNVYS